MNVSELDISSLVNYTDAQKDYLKTVKEVELFGNMVNIGDISLFTTIEGIKQQLMDFIERTDLIYYASFENAPYGTLKTRGVYLDKGIFLDNYFKKCSYELITNVNNNV